MEKEKIINIANCEMEDIYTITQKKNVLLVENITLGERDLISLSELTSKAYRLYTSGQYNDFICELIGYEIS